MKRKGIILALILVAATWFVYWPVKDHEFVSLDDPLYITMNRVVQSGLNRESVVWAFTRTYPTYWHPLTWLSMMVDVELFGLDPGRHHLSSVFLHTINALLLFCILFRMSGGMWKSFLVALLFALHPLHVECVAWATARKDVLSTFFLFLTIWAYHGYTKKKTVKRYLLVLMPYSLGLMSKPMLVTVPFILFLMDFWPLGRLHFPEPAPRKKKKRGTRPAAEEKPGSSVVSLVLEKLPFLGLALMCTLAVSYFHNKNTFVRAAGELLVDFDIPPLALRIANALVSYVVYLWQTIWPVNLALFYPFPVSLPWWQVAGAALLLALISAGAIRMAPRRIYFLVGWMWYLVTLVPAIGLVQPGLWPATADRFTYVPLIGIFIMAAWGTGEIMGRWKHKEALLAGSCGAAAAAVVAALMVVTWQQVLVWRNSTTLWEHALRARPGNWLAMSGMANVLAEEGRFDEAVSLWQEALRIRPKDVAFRSNLARALLAMGRTEQAIAECREALRLAPAYATGHFTLARALRAKGELAEARKHYELALELDPRFPLAHHGLAALLAGQGNIEEAVLHYRELVRLNPRFAEGHFELGVLLGLQGRIDEAVSCYRKALSIRPDFAEAHFSLGSVYARQGNRAEALQHYQTLQGLNPSLAETLLREIEAVP